ncbi:YhgE/Pip domain-containing protein [Cohnella xylanilytica]|uniref:YhgE/Pip domain-containing protein n=1 Tax=Cohnella xylanilytica TaxID=557555 RepID=A0A841TZF9_9BACL|nr:YhgE/Pip domain-containing protein [Cohnella xylanilytica]MBB6691291.1 YhgE/Pip domain-containing protein [Cohnella xylanilytica]
MRRRSLFMHDWKAILGHKQLRAAVAILLFIPVLYAGMFLSGYWNPYAKLDKLPVAVVNLDRGADASGQRLQIGRDMVGELKKSGSLDFRFVGPEEAEDGLKEGRYYLSIVIPEDFSANVASLNDNEPKPARLIYRTNPGNNYVSGQIGGTAVKELKEEVSRKITKTYTETVLKSIRKLSDGFASAGEGASRLSEGAASARDGAAKLQEGIGTLKNGAYKLEEGLSPLTSGMDSLVGSSSRLRQGAASLAGGLGKLSSEHKRLTEGSSGMEADLAKLAAGLQDGRKSAAAASDEAKSLAELVKRYADAHPDLAADESFAALMKQSEKVVASNEAVRESAAALSGSADSLTAGHAKLTEGLKAESAALAAGAEGGAKLSSGLSGFAAGLGAWNEGFGRFGAGLRSLADGSGRLDTGAEQLAQGFVGLVNGSKELSDKLLDAAAESAGGANASDKMLDMFAQPVQIAEQPLNEVPTYGTGSAPYFLTLGLLVGSLMAFNIVPFKFPASPQVSGWKFALSKLGLYWGIGLVQTVIVNLLLLFAFGIEPANVPLMLLYSLIVSMVFMTLLMMLVALLGTFGKLLGVFLVVTQLASSGGTFPFELSPEWIQAVGRCLPMTYALRGFHAVISTANWELFWREVGVLALYIAGFAAVLLVRVVLQARSGKLYPPASAGARAH